MHRRLLAAALAALVGPTPSFAQGEWRMNEDPWGVLAIHMILLPNKNLLIFNRSRPGGGGGEADFGMQLIAPGASGDPTAIQLPDRTMMTLMGSYCGGSNENAEGECPEHGSMYTVRNVVPELWTAIPGSSNPTNHIESLLARDMNLFYPHIFIQPTDGRVFFAASGRPGSGVDGFQQSAIYDNQTLAWSNYLTIPNNPFANVRRTWPSSVMVDGVIYRSGGSVTDAPNDNAVASAVKIDLNATTPTWTSIDDMEVPRKNHTLVALPDGRIVAMGGNLHGSIAGGSDRTRPEALDTEASGPTWQLLQAQPTSGTDPRVPRGYHSTALLLPNASIVMAGGEKEEATSWATQKRAHFFTPEYGGDPDWKDKRPAVLASDPTPPTVIRYGEAFELAIDVAQGRELAKVRLISLGATTHAFNQNQQFVTLSFTESSTNGVYVVDPPSSPNKATPGYYMLFAVDDERVPSVAHIVQLKDFTRAFPSSVTLGSGTSAGTTPVLQEAVLGDNKYIGTRLDSNPQDPNVASLTAVANVASGSYSKVRMSMEMRTSTASSFTWYLRNYLTSYYDIVHSGSCTTSDALYVDVTTLIIAVGVTHVAFGYEYTVQILPLRPDTFGTQRATYRDMNNHGDVVGSVVISGNLIVSFLYRNGNFTRLEVIPNSFTMAHYINDLGQVAGHTNSSPYSTDFLYENGTYTQLFSPINGAGMSIEALEDNGDFAGLVSTPLPTGHEPYAMIGGTFHLVPMPARAQYGSLRGLNANGQGIGSYLRRENTDFSAFSWTREGGIVERPYGSALFDINDLGEIVGRDRDDNGFLERSGSIIPLPGIPTFINNRSEIITIVNRRSMIWKTA